MGDREKSSGGSNSYYTALTSLPMQAKYGNLDTVRSTIFERLMIMMNDPTNKEDVDDFLKDLR